MFRNNANYSMTTNSIYSRPVTHRCIFSTPRTRRYTASCCVAWILRFVAPFWRETRLSEELTRSAMPSCLEPTSLSSRRTSATSARSSTPPLWRKSSTPVTASPWKSYVRTDKIFIHSQSLPTQFYIPPISWIPIHNLISYLHFLTIIQYIPSLFCC